MDAAGVNGATTKVADQLDASNRRTEPNKRICADDTGPKESLGLYWWQDGILTIKPSTGLKKLHDTDLLLMRCSASPKDIKYVTGSWVWPWLLLRPLLLVLHAVFDLSRLSHPFLRRPLTPAPRIDVTAILNLFPFMYADLLLPYAKRVYASDACPTGGGVTYAGLDDRSLRHFLEAAHSTRVA